MQHIQSLDFNGFPFAFVFNGNVPETDCDAELIANTITNNTDGTFEQALTRFYEKIQESI